MDNSNGRGALRYPDHHELRDGPPRAAPKGKGGGLSDLFGGGVSSTLGSSSVVERNLDRITIFFGVLWFVCIIALNWLINH
jgi:protein translocase SecG subunit